MKDKVRISLDVSVELDEKLTAMAEKSHTTKSDILRKGIAIIEAALNAKANEHLGIVDKNNKLVTKIVGIWYMAEQGSEDGNGGGNDQQPPHLLNLKHLSPAYDLNINSRETPEDANHRHRKDFVFFIFSL